MVWLGQNTPFPYYCQAASARHVAPTGTRRRPRSASAGASCSRGFNPSIGWTMGGGSPHYAARLADSPSVAGRSLVSNRHR